MFFDVMIYIVADMRNIKKIKKEDFMVNIRKLRATMVEKDVSVKTLADAIGVDQATMYRRFNAGDTFSIKEASTIAKILDLNSDELNNIFFGDYVADMQQNK